MLLHGVLGASLHLIIGLRCSTHAIGILIRYITFKRPVRLNRLLSVGCRHVTALLVDRVYKIINILPIILPEYLFLVGGGQFHYTLGFLAPGGT